MARLRGEQRSPVSEEMSTIQKFKKLEDADKALFCFAPDRSYYERVARLWDFVDWVCPRKYSQGVFRYRSIEEANRHADEWLMANVELVRKRRKKEGY